MARIHPTAIVSDQTTFGENVVIGPLCIIEGKVHLGDNTTILHRVSLKGPLTIGSNCKLYPNVCIGYEPQDFSFDTEHDGPGVVIGHHNTFREAVTIHRATRDEIPTTIGDHNYFMAGAHAGHDCQIGDHVTLVNSVLLAGHVEVQDHAILGGGAGVHQFSRVGRLCMVSGGSAVGKDIPPFCVCFVSRSVGSLNLVGLRRAGLRKHIKPLTKAFDIVFKQKHSNQHAAEMITNQLGDDPLCVEFAEFIKHTKRGIASYVNDLRYS